MLNKLLCRLIPGLCGLLLLVIPLCGAFATNHLLENVAEPIVATEFNYDKALKTSQDAIDNIVGNHSFTNAEGGSVTFGDFRGKPLVLSMIFTSCYQICPMTTRHLSKIVDKARDALGDDSFAVAVIGFDTETDKPETMQYFANVQGISNKNWSLLSASQDVIDALSKDIGFVYFPSSNGFDHIIQTTIIDANGMVYRQIYGQVFDTPLLVDPLLDLVLGRPQAAQSFISDLSNKIKLFCTTYDPVRDGYYFDYSLFIGMFIGGSIIIFTGFVASRELRKDKKRPVL